jgi:hypothetical protein
MDELGTFRNQVPKKTYDLKGVNTASVHKKFINSENARDTIVGCVGKSGVKVPLFYIKHCRQRTRNKVVIQRRVSGMNVDIQAYWIVKVFVPFLRGERVKSTLFDGIRQGERYTEDYLFAHADRTPLPEKHCLMWDQLSSHKSESVRDFLESLNINVMPLPPHAASDLSPLDNSTFSAWRTLFRAIRSGTRLGMFRAAVTAWEALKPDGIANCFSLCLDVDRDAHSTERWKKTRSELRRNLVRNAERDVEVDPNDLDGDDEAEIVVKEVFCFLFFFFFFCSCLLIYLFSDSPKKDEGRKRARYDEDEDDEEELLSLPSKRSNLRGKGKGKGRGKRYVSVRMGVC